MSEFLMVVPPDWYEVQSATAVVDAFPGGEPEIQNFIASGEFAMIDPALEETGQIQPGFTIVDARMFPTGDQTERLRLWVKFAPV